MSTKRDPTKFHLWVGTVQCFVVRDTPYFWQAFGCAVYDRDKPVLSKGREARAQPIVDRMNSGELTPEQGMELLNEEAYY
jgi:hypothetical protein